MWGGCSVRCACCLDYMPARLVCMKTLRLLKGDAISLHRTLAHMNSGLTMTHQIRKSWQANAT